MKFNRLTSILLALYGCLFFACSEPQSGQFLMAGQASMLPTKPPPLDSNLQAFLDDYSAYFEDTFRISGPPGASIVIVKDDQIIYEQGFGVRSKGHYEPVDDNTLFRVGSLSKGFAGVLTGILVKKGILNWDDPVYKWVPDFKLKDKEQTKRVQVRHLLSHSTGLPYHAFGNLIEDGWELETIVKQYFQSEKLFGKEGEFFGYQNVAFCLIEQVMEAATGKTYEALLREYIFKPAGMKNASCTYEDMLEYTNKALPHQLTANGYRNDSISKNYYNFAAAGGVNASASDMGQWLKLLLGEKPKIVADAVLDEVFMPIVKTGKERRTLKGWIARDSASYAMGWRVLERNKETYIYHAGLVNNFHGEIAFDRKDGIGVCVLFNGLSHLNGNCIKAFFERWEKHKKLPEAEVSKIGPSPNF